MTDDLFAASKSLLHRAAVDRAAAETPDGIVKAAKNLLAAATDMNVEEAHALILRDVDARESSPKYLHIIPLGPVMGIAVTLTDDHPKDSDLMFVSTAAFGNLLPAIGFRAAGPAVAIVAPGRPDVGKNDG